MPEPTQPVIGIVTTIAHALQRVRAISLPAVHRCTIDGAARRLNRSDSRMTNEHEGADAVRKGS
jgi:hypothetical protein